MMTKKSSNTGQSSRHGRVPDGWIKQNIQLPEKLGKEFRQEAGGRQHGGVKLLGTAAIAFIMSLEPDERLVLMKFVQMNTWGSPDALDRQKLKRLVLRLIDESGASAGPTPKVDADDAEWYVDRILDPELTPEPGKKQSDRINRESDGRKNSG